MAKHKEKLRKNKKISEESINKEPEDSLEPPAWMECTWRRMPCNKKDCGICGRAQKEKAPNSSNAAAAREEKDQSVPNSPTGEKEAFQREVDEIADPGIVLEDMTNTLQEGIEILQKIAQEEGVSLDLRDIKVPPRPSTFPLYKEINTWREYIFDLADEADMMGELWTETADAADLFWYVNIISAKSYRQLANRWHLKQRDGYGDFDHAYTRRVLKECLRITRSGLSRLAHLNTEQKGELMLALSHLSGIEKKILSI